MTEKRQLNKTHLLSHDHEHDDVHPSVSSNGASSRKSDDDGARKPDQYNLTSSLLLLTSEIRYSWIQMSFLLKY
jgi:hypothetical protein